MCMWQDLYLSLISYYVIELCFTIFLILNIVFDHLIKQMLQPITYVRSFYPDIGSREVASLLQTQWATVYSGGMSSVSACDLCTDPTL